MIWAGGYDLYHHTRQQQNSTHSFEVDFLLPSKGKLIPLEIKSSGTKAHASISAFMEMHSTRIGKSYLLSQKDVSHDGMLLFKPLYMLPFILEENRY